MNRSNCSTIKPKKDKINSNKKGIHKYEAYLMKWSPSTSSLIRESFFHKKKALWFMNGYRGR